MDQIQHNVNANPLLNNPKALNELTSNNVKSAKFEARVQLARDVLARIQEIDPKHEFVGSTRYAMSFFCVNVSTHVMSAALKAHGLYTELVNMDGTTCNIWRKGRLKPYAAECIRRSFAMMSRDSALDIALNGSK
jgi:Cu2+-containing amine oxidase